MKLAYSNLACPDWPFERTVDAVAEYGFDGLEIRLFDGEVITPDLPPEKAKRAQSALNAAGVQVAALDTSLQVTNPDPMAFLGDLECMMAFAADWGAPVVRVFGGPLPEDLFERQDALKRAGDVLATAGAMGEHYHVAVALETHDDFASSHIVAEVLTYAGGAAWAVYDSHHPHRRGESPAEVMDQLRGYIVLVQVKDAIWVPERSDWQLVPLGEGEVPVRELLAELPTWGYNGWVSLEFEKKWHPELAPPEEALALQLSTLRRWLAETGAEA